MIRLAALLAVACGNNDGIDFPSRLAPLEGNNLAPTPEGTAADPWPEAIELTGGETEDWYWAHARAFVHASVDTTWRAASTVEVCVDRREVDSWSVTHDTVPAFDISYTIHNRVEDLVAVEYDVTWVHEQQGGDADRATRVVAQWDKTDGSRFIDLLEGSVLLLEVTPEITEVQLIAHLDASLRDEQTMISYLRDYYDDLVATAHGEPLPSL